jgi:hypothetical protein
MLDEAKIMPCCTGKVQPWMAAECCLFQADEEDEQQRLEKGKLPVKPCLGALAGERVALFK